MRVSVGGTGELAGKVHSIEIIDSLAGSRCDAARGLGYANVESAHR